MLALSYSERKTDLTRGYVYPAGVATRYESAMSVGQRIRELREARGLTQTALARLVRDSGRGTGKTAGATISQVEAGVRDPSVELLEAIASALDVSPQSFWGSIDPLESSGSRAGIEQSFTLDSTLHADGRISGPVGFLGASGDAADIAAALPREIGRRQLASARRHVSLSGVPVGSKLVELGQPLDVRRGTEVVARWPKGYLLVVEPFAKPDAERELELVVAKRDADIDDEPGSAIVARYATGPEGVELLFPLDGSNRAVTTAQGWEIVGVVTDTRQPPRT